MLITFMRSCVNLISCNVSAIYSEAFFTPRMGQAIMNRLLKAAGHKIINVKERKNNEIALGSDHGGYELKQEIMKHLEEREYGVQRFWLLWSGIHRLSCLCKESSTWDCGR